MFEILIISIGIVLVIEGMTMFIISDKLYYLVKLINNINLKKLKVISLSLVIFGICLIYFTFRYYEKLN